MSETKHTPGPWYATADPDRATWWISQQPEGGTFWIAEAVDGLMNDETEPNARLIAAAPDLLEACQAIDALMENLWKAIDWGKSFNLDVQKLNEAPLKIKRAIKKATEGK